VVPGVPQPAIADAGVEGYGSKMRAGRAVALLVLVLSVVAFGASAAAAAPPPPPVLPHPPPIAATFTLQPDSGPVGTQVTIKGACGVATNGVLFSVQQQTAEGFQTIWIPLEQHPFQKRTPIGVFKLTFTFPSTANFGPASGQPIDPGTYYVFALCNDPGAAPMPRQPFTVT
jgi:hypothetical protein